MYKFKLKQLLFAPVKTLRISGNTIKSRILDDIAQIIFAGKCFKLGTHFCQNFLGAPPPTATGSMPLDRWKMLQKYSFLSKFSKGSTP